MREQAAPVPFIKTLFHPSRILLTGFIAWRTRHQGIYDANGISPLFCNFFLAFFFYLVERSLCIGEGKSFGSLAERKYRVIDTHSMNV